MTTSTASTVPPAAVEQRPASRAGTVGTLLRLLPVARPALPRILLGMLAALCAALVALAIPLVLEQLVDTVLTRRDPAAVWPSVAAVLALGVAEAAFIAARRWLVLSPGTRIEADLRNLLYARLQQLPVAFHDRWPSGQLLSRAVSDLNLIRRWLSFGVVLLVVNLVTIVVGFAVLFTYSWVLALIFFVCCIPLWIYAFRFESHYQVVARRSQDQAGDLATAVEESVHGIRVLKAFGRGGHSLRKFAAQAEQLRGTELEKARAVAGLWLWLLLVPDVAFALCLGAGVPLTAAHQLSVGALFAFFATAAVLRWPIESIGFLLSMTLDTRTAVERVFEIIDEPDPLADPAEPATVSDPRGGIRFEGTRFRYQDAPAGQRDLLDGIDLEIRPGETMALVGLTGSGKTTLTALVTRLYDVTGGRVLLDGVDVRELSREELRRRVAVGFEEATLFSASVRDNVLLGREELALPASEAARAEADRVLAEALEVAQAGFVAELPDGLETRVGEEGLSLSGGQRQRVALARAVAANPDVLVLDDPLSALDVATEELVEAGLRRVLSSTTALIVAHRPSTVALADRVALLQDGRVSAVGTHSELLASNEHYRFVISSLDDGPREPAEHSLMTERGLGREEAGA